MTKIKALFDISKIVVYTDGGARNNPGPAAIGVIIENPSTLLRAREYGEYLGEKTNNQAEYEAVIFALKKAKQLIGKAKAKKSEIEVRMDSELVVKQLNGEYKIKEPELQPLFVKVWNLRMDFGKVIFLHIPREQNKRADKLVNEILDNR